MSKSIKWSGDPGPRRFAPKWQIITPRTKSPVGGISLNNQIVGVWVHWVADEGKKGKDVPCSGEDSCPHCPRALKWKGYLPVYQLKTMKFFVLQISEGCYSDMESKVQDIERLRGWQICIRKETNQHNSRVLLSEELLIHKCEDIIQLPERDLTPFLMKVWGLIDEAEPAQEPPKTFPFRNDLNNFGLSEGS